MTTGANEDGTDHGTPAEVIRLKIDDVGSSGPGNVVNEGAGVVDIVIVGGVVVPVATTADMDDRGLETSVVLDATMDSWELDNLDNVNNSPEIEDGFVEVSEGMLLLLGLVCITDVVMAELGNESPPRTLEDVESWTVMMPVVNVTTDIVCKKVVCQSNLLDSAGLCRNVADGRNKKPVDTTFVEEGEKMEEVEEEVKEVVVVEEGLLSPVELRRIGASEDADKSGDNTVVDGNTCSDVAINVGLLDSVVDEAVLEKTAELADEVADEANKSIIEEAIK